MGGGCPENLRMSLRSKEHVPTVRVAPLFSLLLFSPFRDQGNLDTAQGGPCGTTLFLFHFFVTRAILTRLRGKLAEPSSRYEFSSNAHAVPGTEQNLSSPSSNELENALKAVSEDPRPSHFLVPSSAPASKQPTVLLTSRECADPILIKSFYFVVFFGQKPSCCPIVLFSFHPRVTVNPLKDASRQQPSCA